MGAPYKMKYTNGKKANPSSFPFKVETPKPGDSPLEAWNWDAAGGGAAKGAATGAMLGPWGAVVGGAIGGVVGGIKGGKAREEEEKALEEQEAKQELTLKTGEEKDKMLLVAREKLKSEQPSAYNVAQQKTEGDASDEVLS
tara:strand:- start:979 stop:1401 length:423 start_codon:yes stop_codon:yes gene_type:complete